MPYLQVDLDALEEFEVAGALAGIAAADVAYGLLKLWRHCWRAKVEYVAKERLVAFFGATDEAKLLAAMAGCGFVELPTTRPDVRVKGAEKRLGISKALEEGRRKGGLAAKKNLKQYKIAAGGEPDRLDRLTPGVSAGESAGDVPAPCPARAPGDDRLLSANSQQPTASLRNLAGENAPPGYPALVQGLFLKFKQHRGAEPEPRPKDWKALKRLRERVKCLDAEIIARWERGLLGQYRQRCDTFWDLDEKWDSLGGTGPPEQRDWARGRVGAEEIDKAKLAAGDKTHEF